MSGRLIVLEAVDLAGKSTQLTLLHRALVARGLRVAEISYPDRSSLETGAAIVAFLAGTLPLVAEPERHPVEQMLAGQRLFSLNRVEVAPRLERLIAEHDLVLASRYALSARAYARAGGVDGAAIDALHQELEHELRHPDLTLILDLDPDGLDQREHSEGLDAFERDRALQRRVRAAYRELAAGDPSIELVDAHGTPEQIHRQILTLIERHGLLERPSA